MLNHEERILHYKMYKAKKQWLFAGMGVLLMSGTLMMGGSVTAQADDTAQTVETTGQVDSTSTTADPAAAQQALDAYTNYKTGGYTDAVNQFQQDSQTLNSAKDQYNNQKDAYDNDLTDYDKNQVDAQAPGYETSNPAIKAQLDDTYNSVSQKYGDLKDQATTINDQIETADQNLKTAQNQLNTLYKNLPDSVKAAGTKVADYNEETVPTVVAKLVADSTTQAYSKALTENSVGLGGMVLSVQSLADNSPVSVSAKADIASDGSVSATLYGKKYVDKNDDGKITYEDDVLPVALGDLKSDLDKLKTGRPILLVHIPKLSRCSLT
jgi:KxYKxGKxW signal peptide